MIKKRCILGFSGLLMLILIWIFYSDAYKYNPLGEVEGFGRSKAKKEVKTTPPMEQAWGKEILDKNLFSQRRGAIPPPPPPPPPPQAVRPEPLQKPEKPSLAIKGIFTDEFGEFVAIIEKAGTKALPVRKGDTFDDIAVVNIKEKTVELKWNEEQINLSIEKIKTLHRKKTEK